MSAFLCRKPIFFGKNSIFSPSDSVRDSLALFSVFVRQKIAINESVSFTDYTCGIRFLDYSKLTKNQKTHNDVTISQYDAIINIFDIVFFFLSSLVNSSNFKSISSLALELWQGIDKKSGNRKYPRLSFVQYLKTGTSYEYQIWYGCL